MELIEEGNKFKVIVDYAHAQTLWKRCTGNLKPEIGRISKLICVLGRPAEARQMEKRAEYGKIGKNIAMK